MASENKNENVMLTGQTAYFKKNGSMTNYGVLTKDTPNSSDVYGPGFIDEGSVIKAAKLETSTDYMNTLASMEVYLGEDFIEETEDYQVKINAENIAAQLQEREPAIQNFVDNMNKYSELLYLKCKNTDDKLDMLIPVKLQNNFVLQIYSDLISIYGEEYTLIDSTQFRLWQNTEGRFFINDIELPRIEHGTKVMEITQHDNNLFIKIGNVEVFRTSAIINMEIDAAINLHFATQIYSMKVYGTAGITYNFETMIENATSIAGLYERINSVWYPAEVDIRLYNEYEYANIWSGAMDLGYCPGPNTGIEVVFRMYSSPSSSTNTFRNIIGCYSGYSVSNTMSFGLLVGSGSKIYACRNNNVVSWVDSGVITTSSDISTVTLNKHNDGKFISTGAMSFTKTMSGTATIQNKGGATLWLAGSNDLGRYFPITASNSNANYIPNRSDIYIYNVKIYEGTELVRDYVVAKDLLGQQGMWDKIQNKMYTNRYCSFSIRGNVIN